MIASFACAYCQRVSKDANEIVEEPTIVDGEKYCSRLCAAFALIRADADEYLLSNHTAEFDALLDNALYGDESISYPVKVSWDAAVNCMSDSSYPAKEWTVDDRQGFNPVLVIVGEDEDEDGTKRQPENVTAE